MVAGLFGVLLGLWGSEIAEAQGPQAPRPAISAPQETKVRVARIRITGATVFTAEELQPLVADGEGKELTLPEIEALAGRITAHYRNRGYVLARAYVPAQEIRDGTLEIAVLEGRVGKIDVRGAWWHSPDLLKSYVAPPEQAPVFHAGRYERGLLLLNDLPGLKVTSTLKPGAEVGTTDVVLDVEKDRPITGSVEANNHGARLTGRHRFGVSFDLNNPLGFGDSLSARGVMSEEGTDVWFARGAYTIPVSTWGTRVGGAFAHVKAAVGGEFRELGIAGTGDVGSFFITHPFLRGRAFNLYGQVGFDYKNFKNVILGTAANRDRLRVATAGGAFDAIDGWRGLSTAAVTLHQGFGGLLDGLKSDNDPRASRAGAGGEFTKLTVNLARLQQVIGPISLFLRGEGQWASTRLVSPEQFFVGGVGTVRGYPLAEIQGDHGYALTSELRWSAPGFSDVPAFFGRRWGELFHIFGFVDNGKVFVIDPIPKQKRSRDLTGAGGGLRFALDKTLQISLEYAHRIGRPKPSNGQDNVFYFQVIAGF